MKRITTLIALGLVLINFTFAQTPIKLWSAPYEIDYMTAKETGFSWDSKYFAIGDNSGKITIYESASGNVYTSYEIHTSKVFNTVFQPNGNLLASSDKDGKIVLYDYVARKVQSSFVAHDGAVLALCFNLSGDRLFSGSRDNMVKEWDAANGNLVKTISDINGNVKAVRVTSDNKTLIVGTAALSNGLVLCDIAIGSKRILPSANLVKLDLSPDDKYVATANLYKYISIWDVNTGELKSKIEGHQRDVNDVTFSPDGKVLISGSNDKTIIFWDFDKKTVITTIPGEKNYRAIAVSPNGKYLATMDEKPLICVWDISMIVKEQPAIADKAEKKTDAAVAVTSVTAATNPPVKSEAKPTATSSAAVAAVTVAETKPTTSTKEPVKTVPAQNAVATAGVAPAKMKTATGKKVKDIDLNEYNIVKIGNQSWMQENLAVSKFRNGDLIPEAKNEKEWVTANENKQPAWCYYGFNPANGKKYGKMYNWYAVGDNRGIAPAGWHVPTEFEWVELDNKLEGQRKAAHRLKTDKPGEWAEATTTDSISGFNALPSGIAYGARLGGEIFHDLGYKVTWWSTDYSYNDNKMAVVHGIFKGFPNDEAKTSVAPKTEGLAVRCLKGTPYECKTVGSWMQTNLDVKTFRNGDLIPEAVTNEQWVKAANEKKPAWCKAPKSRNGDNAYGILYNGYAVEDPRGLAPIGWKISQNVDWMSLLLKWGVPDPVLGMESFKEEGYKHWDSLETQKYYAGFAIKREGYNEISNASQFTALPCGRRLEDGKFSEQGFSSYFWIKSDSDLPSYNSKGLIALISILEAGTILNDDKEKNSDFIHYNGDKGQGYSVRCVKESATYRLL